MGASFAVQVVVLVLVQFHWFKLNIFIFSISCQPCLKLYVDKYLLVFQVPLFLLWVTTFRRMSLNHHPGFDCVRHSIMVLQYRIFLKFFIRSLKHPANFEALFFLLCLSVSIVYFCLKKWKQIKHNKRKTAPKLVGMPLAPSYLSLVNHLHHFYLLQGGILWFQNLTDYPNGAFGPILPLLIVGLHYVNVQVALYNFQSTGFPLSFHNLVCNHLIHLPTLC